MKIRMKLLVIILHVIAALCLTFYLVAIDEKKVDTIQKRVEQYSESLNCDGLNIDECSDLMNKSTNVTISALKQVEMVNRLTKYIVVLFLFFLVVNLAIWIVTWSKLKNKVC